MMLVFVIEELDGYVDMSQKWDEVLPLCVARLLVPMIKRAILDDRINTPPSHP